MSQEHIGKVPMVWIYATIIVVMIMTVSNVHADKLDTHGASICPTHCECARKFNMGPITARCEKLTDETYFEANIKHFVLESWDNISLEPYTFLGRNLHYLKSISIGHSKVIHVHPKAFHGLEYLTTVEFHSNQGLFIQPNVFQNSTRLKNLSIVQYNNFDNNCSSTENYLFEAPSLSNLTFSVSNYKCWSTSTFTRMPELTSLRLDTPNLKMIPHMFVPLRKLKKLEIHHANYLDIVENAFNGLDYLEELQFTTSTVSSFFNINIRNLNHLRMEWLRIRDISENDFAGVEYLEKLTMTFSNIEIIHEDAFSTLTELKHLDISNNNIATLTENHLRNNFHLEVLIMNYNTNLKHLPIFKLDSTINNNYSISQLECHDCGLEWLAVETFYAMPNLKFLYLQSNKLRSLPSGLFKSLSTLQLLDLSNNLISFIPEDMFIGAIHLRTLDLSHNPLTTFHMIPFLQTPNLINLNLDMCSIKVWNETNQPLDSILFLSLEGNELERITTEQLATVPNLIRLTILSNPIKCDGVFNKTIRRLLTDKISTKFYYQHTNLCYGGPWDGINCWYRIRDFICDPNYISVSERLKLNNRVNFVTNNTNEQNDIRHYLYNKIASATAPLIVIIFTIIITLTIVRFRSYKRVSKEKITI